MSSDPINCATHQVSPIPCLFSHGKMFPQQFLFGLIHNGYVHPIRVIADGRKESKPEPIPDEMRLWAAGDDCHSILAEAGLLEGLLMAMASDLHQAILSGMSKKRQGTDKRYARQRLFAKLGLPYGTD
jgi:hypothetical protein